MKLFRAWNSCHVPEKTGRVRLCKATFYRDTDVRSPGNCDEKEGETRVLVQGSIRRYGDLLPETTLSIELGDEVSGVAHLEDGVTDTTFKHELRTEIHPVPYIFCASRYPASPDEEVALREFLSKGSDYDAWYTVKDAEALGNELEKAIEKWLLERRVRDYKLRRRDGWVSYYRGEKPDVIADLTDDRWGHDVVHHLTSMDAWFSKRQKYSGEMEYRYAYVIESPALRSTPECIQLDLTAAGTKLFERR